MIEDAWESRMASRNRELAKLQELRSKTDRQLRAIVNDDLEIGLQLARLNLQANLQQAGQAYSEARLLLPAIYELVESERCRLEGMLGELEKALGSAEKAVGVGGPCRI